MFFKLNKYTVLILIILISSIFLISTNFNEITGFVTLNQPTTSMKVLLDENNNTLKTLTNDIFIMVVADGDNCLDNTFIIYQNNQKAKEVKLADKKICEKKAIKYKPELPYGKYKLAVKDLNSGKELTSDFEI